MAVINFDNIDCPQDIYPQLIKQIETAKNTESSLGKCNSIQAFMMLIFYLGQALETELINKNDPAFQKALTDTAEILPKVHIRLEQYVSAIEDLMSTADEGNELSRWHEVCIRRSATDFFFELYEDTTYKEYISLFDVSEVDAMITHYAERVGSHTPTSIPDGVPKSHWWWTL